jgi:hypothetical protein
MYKNCLKGRRADKYTQNFRRPLSTSKGTASRANSSVGGGGGGGVARKSVAGVGSREGAGVGVSRGTAPRPSGASSTPTYPRSGAFTPLSSMDPTQQQRQRGGGATTHIPMWRPGGSVAGGSKGGRAGAGGGGGVDSSSSHLHPQLGGTSANDDSRGGVGGESSGSGIQSHLAAQLEDAKDELYTIYDVVEQRTERVRVAEAERRSVMETYTAGGGGGFTLIITQSQPSHFNFSPLLIASSLTSFSVVSSATLRKGEGAGVGAEPLRRARRAGGGVRGAAIAVGLHTAANKRNW